MSDWVREDQVPENDRCMQYPMYMFDLGEHEVLKLGWEKVGFAKGLAQHKTYTARVVLKASSTPEQVAFCMGS